MKKIVILAIFIFFLVPIVALAEPPPQENLVEQQISQLGIDEIREYWEQIVTEYGGFLPENQKGSFMDFVRGDKQFSLKEWMSGFVRYFLHELIVNGKLLGTLILLTVFSMILQNLQTAFEKNAVSKVANAIVYMVLLIIAINSFYIAINYAQSAISMMINFMIALLPLLLALLASIGSLTSVALFHPLIIFLVNTSGLLIQHFVLPLLFLSALLSLVSTLTDHYKVSKLANLLRNISVGTLGIFLTVFLGVISVQGAVTAVADGITIRTAKFVTGNFVPVVGRVFTDAADTVMGASILLKNTVGIVGLAILLLICAFPAIKVLTLALIFNLAAAVLQPLGGGAIINSLSIIGKAVIFVFAALATVCLMFFLAITIMVAAGNLSLMMR
ncbi:stage III sporulation protein AE [Anaerobacillus isosaccharinicus]|uniref:Stage III sporulation protein AE n=1 Tax=Anaerobacillus isosaccharinicus TaxID=1532552 RepID=A0A1S2MF38_9BACI|nr:stage III sporulation protein AE [Anaerobacillus isosaccharinicus]MBA5585614.1 stage III sporulation protein AE [Anaerobacillus isosaccharinicus]QOY36076.1 stage III sporulation protein AE [Anaerobacillus isosaccharinicus]